MDEQRQDDRTRLTRRRLLVAAGGAAAAAGLVTLPGCGEEDDAVQAAVANADVDAPQLRNYPYIPSQTPLNCSILGYFTADEALAVDAISARLIPGTADDPGAREACVTNFIDRKLDQYETFATPTYEKGPFAKPAKGHPVGFDGDTVYVEETELPRYGFQSGLSPQEAYRKGLAQLDAFVRGRYGKPFPKLPEKTQDDVLGALELNDKSEKGRKAFAKASAAQKALARAIGDAFTDPSAFGFFSMVQDDVVQGMFADPLYGGNRDFAGWKLIGYPGAQRAYTPEELKTGPRERTLQGLKEMHALHPGRPSEHAILPVQGTRRLGG